MEHLTHPEHYAQALALLSAISLFSSAAVLQIRVWITRVIGPIGPTTDWMLDEFDTDDLQVVTDMADRATEL